MVAKHEEIHPVDLIQIKDLFSCQLGKVLDCVAEDLLDVSVKCLRLDDDLRVQARGAEVTREPDG